MWRRAENDSDYETVDRSAVKFLAASCAVTVLLLGGILWLHQLPVPASPPRSKTNLLIQVSPSGEAAAPDHREDVADRALLSTPLEKPRRARPLAAPPVPPVPFSALTSQSESGMADSEAIAQFLKALSEHISHYNAYPSEALAAHLQGTVVVILVLNREGRSLDMWVEKSSGSDVLDAAAVHILKKAAPLPAIPPNLPERMNVSIPIAFSAPKW